MKAAKLINTSILLVCVLSSISPEIHLRDEALTSTATESLAPTIPAEEDKEPSDNTEEGQEEGEEEDSKDQQLEDKDGDLDIELEDKDGIEKQQPTSPLPTNSPTSPKPKNPLENDHDQEQQRISCHEILNAEDQCKFAHEHCQDYKIGFVNYVNLYYCQQSRWFSLIAYVLILVILFTSLGITASEFLCPNLDTLAKLLKMSESLAGVTLLALGNGSPDVFSTLEAMKIDSPSLAIGELAGAAMFITCVVVGCMAIIKPFKVNKRPFVRDTAFLLISVVVTIVFLSDQDLNIVEAFVMMALYISYVVFVVFWDWIATRRRKARVLDQKLRSQAFDDVSSKLNLSRYPSSTSHSNEQTEQPYESTMGFHEERDLGTFDELNNTLETETLENFEEWKKSSVMIRPSLLSALDLNHKYLTSPNPESRNSTDQISLNTLHSMSRSKLPLHSPSGSFLKMNNPPHYRDANDGQMSSTNVQDIGYFDPMDDVNKKLLRKIPPGILVTDESTTTVDVSNTPPMTGSSSTLMAGTGETEEEHVEEEYPNQFVAPNGSLPQRSRRGSHSSHTSFEEDFERSNSNFNEFIQNIIHNKILDDSSGLYLFFPTLQELSDKSLVDMLFTIICLPTTTLLQFTVPVINTDSSTKTIDNDLLLHRGYFFLLTRCFIAPFAASFLIAYKNATEFSFLAVLIPTLISLALCYFVKHTATVWKTNENTHFVKLLHFIVSLIGFIIAITWISTIATELISIIKFFSILFDLSDAILGVTVFAVGNSMADFISNFTIAKMGFPMMALSACFGGPLLNIMLGIGCSSLYIIPLKESDITIKFSATLIVSFITVLINLIFLLVVVPLNGWWMNRMVGFTMIGFWSVATVICVIIEIMRD